MTRGQPRRPAAHPSVGISLIALTALAISAYTVAQAVVYSANPFIAGISMIPLFLVIRLASPITAGLCGAWWGLVFCLFAGARLPAHEFGLAGVMLLLTGGPALYAYGGAAFTRRFGFHPLALALGWIVVELALRSAGFRHGLLLTECGDGVLVRLTADFLGYGFVAFLVVLANALTISLALTLIYRRRYARRLNAHSAPEHLLPDKNTFHICSVFLRLPDQRAPPIIVRSSVYWKSNCVLGTH